MNLMITSEEVREALGMWSRQARPLMRQYITQQEKVNEILKEVKQLLIDMSIDFDEYGMEPTTTTLRSGQEIKNTWFHKIMNKLEGELND